MGQANKQFVCEGCGQRFDNRNDLDRHMSECSSVQGSAGGPKTKTAGGPMPVD